MNRVVLVFFVLSLMSLSCKEKSHERDHGNDASAPDEVEESENQILYNEVMKVHDEVMPKMNDIQRRKETLKNQIATNPEMPADQKKAIEDRIIKLDSAAEGMMRWMRNFNPLPDSTGEEKAREYLENEMDRVKKVREDILQALKEAEEN